MKLPWKKETFSLKRTPVFCTRHGCRLIEHIHTISDLYGIDIYYDPFTGEGVGWRERVLECPKSHNSNPMNSYYKECSESFQIEIFKTILPRSDCK